MARNYYPYNDPAYLAEQNEQKEKCCLGCKFKKIVKNDYMSVIKCKHGNPECPDVIMSECKYVEWANGKQSRVTNKSNK